MDEQKKAPEELKLEDILKEFHEERPEEEEQEDILIWTGSADMINNREPAVPRDTVRLDAITRAVKEHSDDVPEDTVRFTPVGQAEAEEPVYMPQPEEPAVEPFSEKWEPDYEDPIGEYVPPQPIVFKPKSRFWELKRKLVAGPEKRYYDLLELGVGKLQLAIFANLLVFLVSAGATLMQGLGGIGEERTKLVIFIQFLSLLLSAMLGSYQLMEGFSDIFRKRFSLNSLLLFSLAACLIDGIFCLQQQRIPCCAAFSLNMTMSLWSTYHKRCAELGQMDTMRKATHLRSMVGVEDYYEGRAGFLRGEGDVEDFMDTYHQSSGCEKVMSWYALAVLLLSLAVGILAAALYSVSVGFQAFTASLLVAVPASSYVALSRPMALLVRRLHDVGTVLCGWQGVKGLSKTAVFPLLDGDLFPAGTVKLNGLKIYGSRKTDEVISYAAALITASGSGLASLFEQLLESRSGYHYEAEQLRSYSGGVGAVINGEAVLAGNISFMNSMGVEMPEGARVNQAAYVAIDGVLCGVFALTYSRDRYAAASLTTLCAYRGLNPLLVDGDFMLTEGFLRGKFQVNTRRILFPEPVDRAELLEKQPKEDATVLALTTKDTLVSIAYAVTGARTLRSASILGVVIHLLGGILGLAMMLVLGFLGAEHLLTPTNVLLYELLWLIPGLLITEWTRAV